MAGAEAAGDEGFELKNKRLWCIFLIAALFGMTMYQTVLGGVIGTYMGGSLKGTMYFLGVGIASMIFLGVGVLSAYGFYHRLLAIYGVLALVFALLFFVGFIIVLVGGNTAAGKHSFVSSCVKYSSRYADDQYDAHNCEQYFDTIAPAADAICAMGFIISFMLAFSSYLAFKLRTFASSLPDKTRRYEPVVTQL